MGTTFRKDRTRTFQKETTMNANSSSALIQQWFVINDERGSSLVARWGTRKR
jgi:hypothetical protein